LDRTEALFCTSAFLQQKGQHVSVAGTSNIERTLGNCGLPVTAGSQILVDAETDIMTLARAPSAGRYRAPGRRFLAESGPTAMESWWGKVAVPVGWCEIR